MANPLPNALALTDIPDGSQAIAATLRNNFAAIMAAVNLLRAALAGGTAGQFLQAADGTDVQWATIQKYRKTTAKQVVNSVVETDLLNGEITVGAGVIPANGLLRLTAWGDSIQNSGAAQVAPRFKVKLGATTLLDTNVSGAGVWGANAARFGWRIVVEIQNLGATNAQWVTVTAEIAGQAVVGTAAFAIGEGSYTVFVAGVTRLSAIGGGAGAVDTTVAQALGLTVTLPVANAALDMTLKGALVEIV